MFFWGFWGRSSLWFSREKDGFFGSKPSFSREKDGFWRSSPGKIIFFSRKDGFSKDGCSNPSFSREKDRFEPKKPSFSRENHKNPKNHLFQNYGAGASKRCFFFFFFFLFFLGFLVFSRKRWSFGSKPSFSREKDGFTRRRPPKTIFFSRKRWFRTKKTIFFSSKPKKPSFGGPSPIVLEKMFFFFFCFFWIFVFLVFWFLLVSCFVVFPLIWLGLGCHPRWVHWGGGGEQI